MFVCSNCWEWSSMKIGKCPSCGEFWTFAKVSWVTSNGTAKKRKQGSALSDQKETTTVFWPLASNEFTRLFPQGIKQSAAYLLAGEPGIGKSTIMLQLIEEIVAKTASLRCWYFTAEETASQVRERAERIQKEIPETMSLYQTSSCEDIVTTIEQEQFDCIIIDSVQTISTTQSDSASGSPSQVRICCDLLSRICKETGTTLILIGHITKGGEIAWPKYLEHIVDVVLYLEGDRFGQYRFLRFKKNRFGHTDGTGIFEMTLFGLQPVYDLKERVLWSINTTVAWSVITIGMDNGRPVLVQVEVLLNKAVGKYPQRTALWVDKNRLNIILAILEKYLWCKLWFLDVYVNIPGEFRFTDSWLDLAIAVAIRSHYSWTIIDKNLVFLGELWLSWQVLRTSGHQKRLNEASELNSIDYERCKHITELKTVL